MKQILYILLVLVTSCTVSATSSDVTDRFGTVIQRRGVGKAIYFVFTADSAFEGAPIILDVLKKHNAKGSFFLTGNCLRMPEHETTIRRIIADGHYVGGHSDRHLLYADWDEARTNLVTADSLILDLRANYAELEQFGITKENATYFLPPYEWYNAENVQAIRSFGVTPVNFSPRLRTSDDYTTPDMSHFRSSQELIDELFLFEAQHTLDGAIILIHPGTSQLRTDKLYLRFDEILQRLSSLGYTFPHLCVAIEKVDTER